MLCKTEALCLRLESGEISSSSTLKLSAVHMIGTNACTFISLGDITENQTIQVLQVSVSQACRLLNNSILYT